MKKKIKLFIFILFFSLSSIYATYPKVALVLSGGGAKGFAQIGVVDEIMKLGIPIDFICGTSMGGLLGAYYALGYTSQDIIQMIRDNSLFAYMLKNKEKTVYPPSLFKDSNGLKISLGINKNGIGDYPGLIKDQGIISFLNKTTIKSPGEISFDELYIPYRAVAINASTGSEKILDHGFISDSMRATMSLPIVFAPFILKDGTYCMDGGLVDNLPVQVAIDWGADIIISVDVSSDDLKTGEDYSSLSGVILQTINLTTFGNREISQKESDILVKPDVSKYLVLDVGSFEQILEKGYEEFQIHKDEFIKIRDEISKYRDLKIPDKDSISYYSQLKDPIVTSVKFVDITKNNEEYSFTNIFDKYIGIALTSDILLELEEDVLSFAQLNNISSVSYNFKPSYIGSSEGVLELDLRSWEISPSKIDLIGLSQLGFSNNPINLAWFYLSFDVHTQLKKMLAEKMSVDLRLNISEKTEINSKIGYMIKSTNNYDMTLFTQFGTKFGSLSPANNKYIKYYIPTYSIGFDVGLGFDLRMSNKLSLEFLSNYNLISLYSTTFLSDTLAVSFENPILNVINFDMSFSFLDMEDSIFATKGFGANGIGSLKITDGDLGIFGYFDATYNFELSSKDTIKTHANFGYSSVNYQLTSSYFDLGGYNKIPGDYYGAYTREYLLVNFVYQRYLGDFISPLFLQSGITLYAHDSYDPVENIFPDCNDFMIKAPNSSRPKLSELGIGIFSGIGFNTNYGDIIIGGGISINGNFNIVLEFV